MSDQLEGEFVLGTEKPEKDITSTVEDTANNNAPSTFHSSQHGHNHTDPHFFSSLGHYPNGVTFLNQEADEEVVLLIRRDFITNVPWILSILLLGLVPPIAFFVYPLFFPPISLSLTLIVFTVAFYYLIVFGFALMYFAIWYFNAGIVTTKRIVDLDVPNILIKEASEARLAAIADVTFNQTGSIRSFFDYGDVEVQTEAVKANIEFDRAPNPNFIRKTIGELIVDNPPT